MMIFIDRHRGTLQWLRVLSAGGSAHNKAMALYNAFAFYVLSYFCCLMFVSCSVHSIYQKKSLILDVKCLFFYENICFSRGWQGLIAYGCHSLVLIVDANTAQTLQVLERHKASVVKVSCMCFKVYYSTLVYILFF